MDTLTIVLSANGKRRTFVLNRSTQPIFKAIRAQPETPLKDVCLQLLTAGVVSKHDATAVMQMYAEAADMIEIENFDEEKH